MVAYTGQLVTAAEETLASAAKGDREAFNSGLVALNSAYTQINLTMDTMWGWSRPIDYLASTSSFVADEASLNIRSSAEVPFFHLRLRPQEDEQHVPQRGHLRGSLFRAPVLPWRIGVSFQTADFRSRPDVVRAQCERLDRTPWRQPS